MSRGTGIAGAALALFVVVGATPVAGHAQVFERPRRASSSYDRAFHVGYDEGYRSGYERGVSCQRNGDSNSPTDYKEYRRGDDGYNDSVVSREDYKLGFRAGFEQGMQDGYAGNQYGG